MKRTWIIAAMVGALLAGPAMAVDYIWSKDAADSTWENPANWILADGSAATSFPNSLDDNAYINTRGIPGLSYDNEYCDPAWIPEVVISQEITVGILKFGDGWHSDARLTVNNNITLNQFLPGALYGSGDFQFTMGAYTMRLVNNGDSPAKWDAGGANAWGWNISQSTIRFDGSGSFSPRYGAIYGDIYMTSSPANVVTLLGGARNEPQQNYPSVWDFGPGTVHMNGTLRTFGTVLTGGGTIDGDLAQGFGLTLSCWNQFLPSGVVGCTMWSDPWTGGGTYAMTGDLTAGLMDFRARYNNGMTIDATSDNYDLTLLTSLRLGEKMTLLAHDATVTILAGTAADDGNYAAKGLVLYGENSKIVAGNAVFNLYGSWDSSAADADALDLGTSVINLFGEGTLATADGQLVHALAFVSGSSYTLLSNVASDGGALLLDGKLTSFDGLLNAGVLTLGGDYALTGFTEVPEPATMTLLALGGLALLRRRR